VDYFGVWTRVRRRICGRSEGNAFRVRFCEINVTVQHERRLRPSLLKRCTAVACWLSRISLCVDVTWGHILSKALFSSVQSVRDSSLNRAKTISHVSSLRYTRGGKVFSQSLLLLSECLMTATCMI